MLHALSLSPYMLVVAFSNNYRAQMQWQAKNLLSELKADYKAVELDTMEDGSALKNELEKVCTHSQPYSLTTLLAGHDRELIGAEH